MLTSWYVSQATLARRVRMPVTIGRRELIAAFGSCGCRVAARRDARSSAQSRRGLDICHPAPRPTSTLRASSGEWVLWAMARAATSSSRLATPRRDYSKFPALADELLQCASRPHRRRRPRFPDLATGSRTSSGGVSVQRRSGGRRHRLELRAAGRQHHRRFTPFTRPFDQAPRLAKGSHSDHDSRGSALQSHASRASCRN